MALSLSGQILSGSLHLALISQHSRPSIATAKTTLPPTQFTQPRALYSDPIPLPLSPASDRKQETLALRPHQPPPILQMSPRAAEGAVGTRKGHRKDAAEGMCAQVVNFSNLNTGEVVEGDITKLDVRFLNKLGDVIEGDTQLAVIRRVGSCPNSFGLDMFSILKQRDRL